MYVVALTELLALDVRDSAIILKRYQIPGHDNQPLSQTIT